MARPHLSSVLSKVGLRAQLATLFCIALLPGFALLFWIRGEIRQSAVDDANQTATQLAQLVAETQVSRTQGVEQLITTFATIPALRSPTPAACSEFLRDLVNKSSRGYLNFGLLDARGRVLCTAIGSPGFSLADNPAFVEAMRTDKLTITPIVRGRLIGRDVFSYMRRIDYENHESQVVFVGFGLDTVADSLTRVPLPANASLAVVRTDGEVIAAYPKGGDAPMRGLRAEIRAMRTPTQLFTVRGDDGITRAIAAVHLPEPDSVVALAAMPTGAATADGRILTAVLIFGASSLGMLVVALLLANYSIRRPIRRLLNAMARVRRGNLDVRAGLEHASPEVRALSDGFDAMTAQLQQRELRTLRTQRLEAVGQLAGGIAHDFNNMLTVIIGFGEELRGHVQPTGEAHLDEVLAAGARAKELTHQLLAFSRRQVLNTEPVHLNRTLQDLSRMLERVIGEHVRLDLHLAGELPMIRVDRTQLDQVVTNLVVNARDAMPDGGILTIATDSLMLTSTEAAPRSDLPPGRYVRLSVADTGHGMDPETLSHVFEPFFTTKEGGKGTGLGLATVYGIVRQSGGYVLATSTPNGGTKFEVYFPAIAVVTTSDVPAPPLPPARGTGETILVVEDEPGVRRLTVTVLRRAGYTVLEAADAHEAEAIVHTPGVAIALLLTDIVLPGGPSGVTLGRSLQALRPDLIVVHMSGYSRELAARPSREGQTPFVGKPFTPAALLKAVADALTAAATRTGR